MYNVVKMEKRKGENVFVYLSRNYNLSHFEIRTHKWAHYHILMVERVSDDDDDDEKDDGNDDEDIRGTHLSNVKKGKSSAAPNPPSSLRKFHIVRRVYVFQGFLVDVCHLAT